MVLTLAVLISGQGSNLQALIDAISKGDLPETKIALVLSNRKDAKGLVRAQRANIPTCYHNLVSYGKRFPSSDTTTRYGTAAREAYDMDLATHVLSVKPSLVVMAGFMHIVTDSFLEPLAKANVPAINLHPALPNEYNGAKAIERAFIDFQEGKLKDRTGVCVHYVIADVDAGAPIITQEVEIKDHDTLDDLEARMHDCEHLLIVSGTRIALEELHYNRT